MMLSTLPRQAKEIHRVRYPTWHLPGWHTFARIDNMMLLLQSIDTRFTRFMICLTTSGKCHIGQPPTWITVFFFRGHAPFLAGCLRVIVGPGRGRLGEEAARKITYDDIL